jgi:hypothetical protein
MKDSLVKLFNVIQKLIDAAPKAVEHIKALKDEAREALRDEPALANAPEVKKAVSEVIEKAAAATPEPEVKPAEGKLP